MLLRLRVAAEAEIVVGLGEHHAVDRAVRVVAGRAAFAQGGMLEDKRPRLLAMALGAGFVGLRHGQAARRLENVLAVRVVALDAVHVAFDDGMMHGQLKFRVRRQMAAEAGVRRPCRGLMMNLPMPPPASTCLLPGPWQDSQPVPSGRAGVFHDGDGRAGWLRIARVMLVWHSKQTWLPT